jgi:hypothetical protein
MIGFLSLLGVETFSIVLHWWPFVNHKCTTGAVELRFYGKERGRGQR